MTMEEKRGKYQAERQDLMSKAEEALSEGKVDESNEIVDSIKVLDEKFEEACKASANLEAMKDKTIVTDIAAKSLKLNELKVADKFESSVPSANEGYMAVFGKFLKGESLNKGEQEVFDSVNSAIQNATTSSDNGAVIPVTLMPNIIQKMSELHPVLSDILKLDIEGAVTIAVDGDCEDPETDFYGETDETGEYVIKTAKVDLSSYDLARDAIIPWKLRKMSAEAFINYVMDKVAEKLGNALANAVFNGKGVAQSGDTFKSQPLGVITKLESQDGAPRIMTYTAATTSDEMEAKIRELLSKVKSGYKPAFYANADYIWNVLAGIKDAKGNAYFVADPTSGGVGRIFGVVVKEEDGVPNNYLVLGSFAKGYVVNFNQQVSILSQEENSKRQTRFTGYGLVDGQPALDEAFVCLKKS